MLCFIDESGTHTLDPTHIDKQYSVFVLGAVVFSDKEYIVFDKKFKLFKEQLFGKSDFIIHTAEITRPSKSKNKVNLQFLNKKFRSKFYKKLAKLILDHKFTVIAHVIKKSEYFNKFGYNSSDPYIFSFEYLLNDILGINGNKRFYKIFPEKRTHIEDKKLLYSFRKAQKNGTNLFTPSEINHRIKKFTLRDKQENLSGQQLIDLIVTPIGRHAIGKKPKPLGNELLFQIVRKRLLKGKYRIFP